MPTVETINFLKLMYRMGKVSEDDLQTLIHNGKIKIENLDEIISE